MPNFCGECGTSLAGPNPGGPLAASNTLERAPSVAGTSHLVAPVGQDANQNIVQPLSK
jgi:hypothetical protein